MITTDGAPRRSAWAARARRAGSDAWHIRVAPVDERVVVDLKSVAKRPTSADEINGAVKRAAEQAAQGQILGSRRTNVSIDFNHVSDLRRASGQNQGMGGHDGSSDCVVRQ